MKTNKITVLLIIVLMLAFIVGCASQSDIESETGEVQAATQEAMDEPEQQLELTIEELAMYNGKEGNPAYIAVDGIIYDVSDIAKWKDGEHNGYSAGQDLTEAIKTKSPHGVSKLNNLNVIGKIVE